MPGGRLTISELARRAEISVRTLRFWSDEGLIPVASRSAAGYRLYDEAAVARLRLVGTLRALGLGLDAIAEVLRGRRGVAEVAQTHADALTSQLRLLRMQRAVLRAVARRCHDTQEMTMVHALATATAAERQRIVDDFAARVCAGLPHEGRSRSIIDVMRRLPEALPDDPSDEHVDAWLELAGLVADPSFVARVRTMAEAGAAPQDPSVPQLDHEAVLTLVTAARDRDLEPASPAADAILTQLGIDALTPDVRVALRRRLETFTDVRVERYWVLLGRLNEQPPFTPMAACYQWIIDALRSREPG